MNHYPDNYHGYGRDASNMQGMAYGGYRQSSNMRGHPAPEYQGGSYPMGSHPHGGVGARGMYGQGRPGPYNMTNYGHYNSSGYTGHQSGMVNPYYNSHNQMPGSGEGYNMHHSHHMGMISSNHQRNSSAMGPRGGTQHCVSPAGQDHYGAAYPGQGSPSRMHLQHQGHTSHPQVPVPPHPMRQTNTQQNPQEVADNILQMASSYPSNQTVQVPLKNRPAPYHIPRSPHYTPKQDHSHHSSPSPHQQQAMASHASPSPTSGVKSPISQNPTPSPGPGMLRSPSGQVMSPCGSQRSPSHSVPAYSNQVAAQTSHIVSAASHSAVASSSQPQQYLNHHHHNHPPKQQSHLVHHSDSPHYSPCSMVQSPYSASPSAQVQAAPYSPHNPNHNSAPPHHQHQPSTSSMASSPPANMASPSSIGLGSTFPQTSAETCNNPLMSLEKLVMLPETQVVDPKSVVNDACLSTQSEEGSKNVEDPAERPAESSGHSVGCSGISSSLLAESVDTNGFAKSDSQLALNSITSQSDQVVLTTSSQFDSNLISDPLASNSFAPSVVDSNNFDTSSESTYSNSAQQHDNGDAVVNLSFLEKVESRKLTGASPGKPAIIPSDADNVSEGHTDGKVPSSTAEGLKTIQAHSNSPIVQSDKINDQSCVSTKETSGSSNISSHSKTGTAAANVDLLPIPLPKDQRDLANAVVLSESVNGTKESNLGSVSSQEVVHYPKHCAKPLDNKEARKQELMSASIPMSNSSESPKHVPENEGSLFTISKSLRAKEEIKLSPVPCHLPSVLSEVPIILNGVEGASACDADDDQELDLSNGIHSKVHNKLSNVVKSKFGFSRRAAHLTGITPCSIAVEASERAVCERFSLRRNGLGRVTRTSINRERNNSTGNGDSDESLENISSSPVLSSRDPQDGTKKRGPSSSSKRNGFSKPAAVSSFPRNSENSSSSKRIPIDKKTNAVHGASAGSDEELCYYEGVDNSYDMYMNTMSSDESGQSDDKGCENHPKHQNHLTSSAEVEVKPESSASSAPADKKEISGDDCSVEALTQKHSSDGDSPNSLSPPAKRLRTSPSFSSTKQPSINHVAPQEENEVIDLTSETPNPLCKKESISPGKQRVRSTEKFRPSILSRRNIKYPVVVLEKSPIISPKLLSVKNESSDLINVSEGSIPQQLSSANLPDVKLENVSCSEETNPDTAIGVQDDRQPSLDKVTIAKEEIVSLPEPSISSLPKKNSPKKKSKKRKAAKPKGKGKEVNANRQSEVKDSFKSMKFGRTLDLMKANRKRENNTIGPFVRIVGHRSCPKTVSVFAQPTAETMAAAKQGKTNAGTKKGQSMPTVTTVHMVSNFTSKQPPMVPSTRTISHKPWVCAFCGHHSSYKFLGDLFGPYFKENEVGQAEKLALEETKKADSERNLKPQDIGKKNVGKSNLPSTSAASARHHKRKSTLLPRVNEDSASLPEEMWVHQACALWSPGVCLVGNKMYGLDEAVKDAAETACSECKSFGAIIGCLHKGCPMKYHFVCAIEKDCYMDEENLSLLCPKHKEKKFGSVSKSKS